MVRVFEPFRPRAGKDFTPAKPLVEVKPDVPPTIAESLHGELKLMFRVWVDKAGRVDDVESLSTGADHRFVGLADIALRHWEFEPARFKDRPEASRLLITVRFRNPFLTASAAPQTRE